MKYFFSFFFLFVHFGLFANEPPDTIKSSNDKELLAAPLVEELRQGLVDLRIAEKEKSQAKMLDACLRLGKMYRRQEFHVRALNYFRQAETLAQNTGMEAEWMEAQTLVAQSLLDNGQSQEAHDAFLTLLEKHEKTGDYQASVLVLQKLADASVAMRRFSQANDYYLKIKALALAHKDVSTGMAALNNLGFAANKAHDYAAAARYFSQADSLAVASGLPTPGYVFTNLGIALHNLGETKRSVEVLQKADDAGREDVEKSYVQHLIATIYLKNEDVYGALRYNEQALKSAAKSKNAQVLCDAYEVASLVYQQLYEHDKALDFYRKHLWLKDSLLREERLNQQNLENLHALLEQKEHEISQNLKDQEIDDLDKEQQKLRNHNLQIELEKREIESERNLQALALSEKDVKLKDAELRQRQLEADRASADLRLKTQQLLALEASREIEKLEQAHMMDSLDNARETAEQQGRIALLEKDKRLNELELAQQEQFRQSAYRLGALLAAILLVIFGSWLYARRLNKRLASQNRQIASQKEEIDAERGRAENLLLNILPTKVAQELKSTGTAKPQHYDSVTVLFTDFQGFTKIASTMPPAQVVQELNECFLAFDEIVERHNLEKIKTMGDSYMCAGGLPVPNRTHPHDAVAAATEMLAFIQNRNRQNAALGKPEWQIRIGVHTGEVVAGVVGSKKFAYDIWGDTVNVASRMESNCVPGFVNLSEATYRLVNQRFAGNYRGEVEVKNKGKMGMYLVGSSKEVMA